MSPDLRIRNIDTVTHERLLGRAKTNGRSVEAELRVLLGDALGNSSAVSASDWERTGFIEPKEIVPGRQYEVYAGLRHFRISIARELDAHAGKPWDSTIDELVEITVDVDGRQERVRVWTNPLGIADRRMGDTAELALRDAMHWLSDYAGVDPISRARRSSEQEATMHPGLHFVAESLRGEFGPAAEISWQGSDVARVSIDGLDFTVSRLAEMIAITWPAPNSSIGEWTIDMSPDVGSYIATHLRGLAQASTDRSNARQRKALKAE